MSAAAVSLGGRLERDRLVRRAGRIEAVVAALRLRASEHARVGERAPAPLLRALGDFQEELAAIRQRLDHRELQG
jgi:hypothetical protein